MQVERPGATPTSRRGSTPSSPVAPGAAGSTSRATRWCCGSRASTRRPSPGWPAPAPTRCVSTLPAVLQHGRQPGRLGRGGAGPRAAGDLLRPVPGRPLGGRAGAHGAAQPHRARRLRRGHDVPPRRLRSLRGAAARGSPSGRPRSRREGAANRRAAAAQSLEKLKVGDVVRVPQRQAGRPRRRASTRASVRDRRAACPLVVTSDRWAGPALRPRTSPTRSRCWPGSGCPSTSTTAARPPVATWPRRSGPRDVAPTAGLRAQGPLRRRRRRRAAAAAPGAARPPLPRLRRAGGPRPLGGALEPAAPRDRRGGGQGGGQDRHDRPHLRPGLRGCCASTATSPTTTTGCWWSPRPAGGCPGSTARATCSPRSACARASGAASTPPSSRPASRCWSTSPAATSRPGRGCRSGSVTEVVAETQRIWADPRRHRGPVRPRLPARARPRLHRGRVPAGRPGDRWRRCSPPARTSLGAGDFVRWVRQLIDLLGQIAVTARDEPVGGVAEQAVDALRRGVLAYSSPV